MPKSRKRTSARTRKPTRSAANRPHHISVMERGPAARFLVPASTGLEAQLSLSAQIEPIQLPLERLSRFEQMIPASQLPDTPIRGRIVSAGLMLSDLIERNVISRCLISCSTAAGPQWAEELSKQFGIRATFAERGRELTTVISNPNIPVAITTYETASERVKKFQPGQFDLIIQDDAQGLRYLYCSTNPSAKVQRLRDVLDSAVFRYIMLPSTKPNQVRAWDMYTPADLLKLAADFYAQSDIQGQFRARFSPKRSHGKALPIETTGFPSMFSDFVPPAPQEVSQLKFPKSLFEGSSYHPDPAQTDAIEALANELERASTSAQLLFSQTMSSSLKEIETQLELFRDKSPLPPPSEDAPAIVEIKIPRELLAVSPISGREGLKTEFKKCEITGIKVLPDELVRSDQSGRYFRKDEAVKSAESELVGHDSEMVECSASHSLILESESDISAISGSTYSKSILYPSEKNPERLGLESELITCSKTGKSLLVDEALQSSITGQWYDRELCGVSARSGKVALLDELVICEETGVQLLPEECGICSVTSKRVDKALLGTSDLSGKTALLTHLEQCTVTGKNALPSELETCDISGKRADPAELETCAVSGKRAIRYQLVRSDLSGALVLPEHAVWSPATKRCAIPSEAILCTWRNVYFPKDEVAQCRLTGLTFSRGYLNAEGEFKILRELLDGTEPGADGANLLSWLIFSVKGVFQKLKRARCVISPDGVTRAVCGEIRTMFGFKTRYAGAVISGKGAKQVLGNVTTGKRNKTGWTAGE